MSLIWAGCHWGVNILFKQKNIALISRYTIVGGINSIFGYACIFALMGAGVSAGLSNILGYVLGFAFSYMAHRLWTFKSTQGHGAGMAKYLLSVCVAYGLNFAVLVLCIRVLEINAYLSQIIAGFVYVVVSFVLLKFFAFKY